MPRKSLRTSSEDLLRQTRQLKQQLRAFKQAARAVVGPLDKIVSDAEAAAMETPRANALGTLETLLNQDLGDFLRQLNELDGCLRANGVAGS